jgi:hypothetical protein
MHLYEEILHKRLLDTFHSGERVNIGTLFLEAGSLIPDNVAYRRYATKPKYGGLNRDLVKAQWQKFTYHLGQYHLEVDKTYPKPKRFDVEANVRLLSPTKRYSKRKAPKLTLVISESKE